MKDTWKTPYMYVVNTPDGLSSSELAAIPNEELMALLLKKVRYRTSDGFVTREIAGEVLAVPVGTQAQRFNGMITFSEAGAFLWKLLESPMSKDEMSTRLAAEYGKENADVQADVNEFVDRALMCGLIVQCD